MPRAAPVFGPFRPFVDEILAADETAPRKQRHTASQIYRRLVAEKGYTGKYDQVRRYLRQRRLDRRETFIPLEHRPGVRAEADFRGATRPAHAQVPHLRDEWRKLSLPRVDEDEERQGRQEGQMKLTPPRRRFPS